MLTNQVGVTPANITAEAIPRLLNIPSLREGETATISWEEVDGAAYYELEQYLDESIMEEPGEAPEHPRGLTWWALSFLDKSWEEWAREEGATWDWLASYQPTTSTVYRGAGMPMATPYEGMAWGNAHGRCLSWEDMSLSGEDEAGFSWQEFDALSPQYRSHRSFFNLYMKLLYRFIIVLSRSDLV
ncbi:hypothetical protein LJC63_06385 [Ruminococcaceae bacterium OttesenSCG-928-L11]|nr:hypothetical protein [Ruminococcaceae bacterium OttesenSCG-928-L11]